ncbi:putative metallo-hydrolase YflN [compost metagenome]
MHPVLLVDEDGLTLIDTGMFDQYEALIKAIEEAGEAPSSLKRIILTHQDTDHIGNLPALARQFPGVRLFAHPGDLPVISGSQPMLKMTPERIAQLPPERREAFGRFLEQLKQLPEIEELQDAERLPWGGGLEIIHTPGHTPGHICLYLREQELLLAADELRVLGGELAGPWDAATPDMPLALRSLLKLKDLPVRTILCYHGGVYEGSPQALIGTLTESLL